MAGPSPVGCPAPALAFRAADPTLDVNIYAPAIAADVTGKSVTKGSQLQFGIITNQYAALTTGRVPFYGTSTGDGYIDLKVRTESGGVLNNLITDTSGVVRLSSINVTTQPYTWGTAGLDADTACWWRRGCSHVLLGYCCLIPVVRQRTHQVPIQSGLSHSLTT